jgi:hypothetical protein
MNDCQVPPLHPIQLLLLEKQAKRMFVCVEKRTPRHENVKKKRVTTYAMSCNAASCIAS